MPRLQKDAYLQEDTEVLFLNLAFLANHLRLPLVKNDTNQLSLMEVKGGWHA